MAMYLIITSYVYDFLPILFLQVHHHNNFKPVKERPVSRPISCDLDVLTCSDLTAAAPFGSPVA
jgi:hypothetical protein